jgi:2'-5' RNA ligase
VAIAASLWFDPTLEAAVRGVWADLASRGVAGSLHAGPHRPHLTHGIWERMDAPAFSAALRTLAAGTAPLPIVLDRVGAFGNAPHVVWLGPRPDAALAALHRDVQALGGTHGSGAFARQIAGAWNPHVTIAWGLSNEELANALEMLRTLLLPLPGPVPRSASSTHLPRSSWSGSN